ncbi:unnamed protein product, partial [Pelagomonas calceolata]
MRRRRSWTSASRRFATQAKHRTSIFDSFLRRRLWRQASNHDGAPPEHRSTRDGGPQVPLSRRARAQYATFGRSPSTRWRRSALPVATARQAAPTARISTSYSGEPVRAASLHTASSASTPRWRLVGARARSVTTGPSPSLSSSGASINSGTVAAALMACSIMRCQRPAAATSWCAGSVGTSRGGGSSGGCFSTDVVEPIVGAAVRTAEPWFLLVLRVVYLHEFAEAARLCSLCCSGAGL